MDKTIIFYAPVGNGIPVHMLGGGEKGCRRTQEILADAGYNVITIDKATMAHGSVNYLKQALVACVKILKNLIKNKNALLYVVGFYEKNIYLEYLIISIGKILRHKVIYEARNGRLVKAYYEYGNFYKKRMDSVLNRVDLIFAQGKEYVNFISDKYNKHAIYTPNYVMNRDLRPYEEKRSMDQLQIIYFGRVSPSKNVDVVLKTANELSIESHIPIKVIIIGGYEEEYRKKLDKLLGTFVLPQDNIIFMGPQPFDTIIRELQKAHFFIFPSQEKMEGHSNALTEAMAFGVVPVASNAGFNRSICGEDSLIIDGVDYKDYSAIIKNILDEGNWKQYSIKMYNRVKDNYTEDIVKKSILSAVSVLIRREEK